MGARRLCGWVAVGLFAAAVAACGDDGSADGTGGAPGTGSNGPATTTGGGGPTGSGGGLSDGNNVFEEAAPLGVGPDGVGGELLPVTQDVDYYWFTGTAGQKLRITAESQPDAGSGFDPAYLDLLVTVYDQDQQRIAQNDDPFPRTSADPEVFTELPADGIYYLRIGECNRFYSSGCGDPSEITDRSYRLVVREVDPATLTEERPGDVAAIQEVPGSGGGEYGRALVSGHFEGIVETDTFSFTVPSDVVVEPGQRQLVSFGFFPAGSGGTGSSVNVQRAAIVDEGTGMAVAQVDPRPAGVDAWDRAGLLAPLVPGGSYRLELSHMVADVGERPFYFSYHHPDGRSRMLELEGPLGGGNDDAATAEALMAEPPGEDGELRYFVEAELSPPGDADQFSFEVPAGVERVSVLCRGERDGSGVRALRVALRGADDVEIVGGSVTEAADRAAAMFDVAVPVDETPVYLRVTGAQEPTVGSSYYRCEVRVPGPPMEGM